MISSNHMRRPVPRSRVWPLLVRLPSRMSFLNAHQLSIRSVLNTVWHHLVRRKSYPPYRKSLHTLRRLSSLISIPMFCRTRSIEMFAPVPNCTPSRLFDPLPDITLQAMLLFKVICHAAQASSVLFCQRATHQNYIFSPGRLLSLFYHIDNAGGASSPSQYPRT